MKSTHTTWALVVFGTSLGLGLGACSSDDEPNAEASTPPDASITSPAPDADSMLDSGPGADAAADVDVPPGVGSGTRLRRVYYAPIDGDRRQFVGLYDTELGFDCQPFALGTTPSDDPFPFPDDDESDAAVPVACAPALGVRATPRFADATCTQEIWTPAAGHGATDDGQCATHIYEDDGAIFPLTPTPTPTEYFIGAGETCRSRPASATSDQPYYAVGAPLPTSKLAVLDAVSAEVAPGLRSVTYVSADGARFDPSALQNAAGEDCVLAPNTDGTVGCQAGPTTHQRFFDDASCTVPMVAADYASHVRLIQSDTCPARFSVHATGPTEFTGTNAVAPPVGDASVGECKHYSGTYYLAPLLAEVPPAELGSYAVEAIPAGARLTAVTYTYGQSQQLAYYTDALRSGLPCRFLPTADGTPRCLPYETVLPPTTLDASTTQAYTDAECTEPIRVLEPRTDACTAPDQVVAMDPAACPAHAAWNVYPLAAESPAGTFYYRPGSGTTCQALGVKTRALGAPLPPTDFAEGVRVVD